LQWLCFTASYPVASLPYLFEPLRNYSNSNMRIWVISTIGIKLFLLAMFHSTLVNPIFTPSHQCYLNNILIKIISLRPILYSTHLFKLQMCHLSKVWYLSIIEFYSCYLCGVDQINMIASIQYSIYPIETLNRNLKCYLPLLNPMSTWSRFHV
jgi:hypothetical protein